MNCSNIKCKIEDVKKTDRRILRTKKSIAAALISLMNEKSLDSLTVKELCEKADINRKTFYNYFKGTDDVLSQEEDKIVSEFEENCSELKGEKSDIADILLSAHRVLGKNGEFIHTLAKNKRLSGLEKKFKESIKKEAAAIVKARYPEKEDTMNSAMEYMISGAVAMQFDWFFKESEISFEELCRMNCEFVEENLKTALSF